jgi:hypothetical protein
MKRLTRRGTAVGAALVVAVGSAGAAWAWQIGSGSGSTTVHSATITDLIVTAGPDPVTGLFPGGSANLTVKVINGNTFPVKIISVNRDGTISADAAHASNGCAAPQHGVATTKPFYVAAQLPAQRTVPPHDELVLTIPNAVTMAANSPDACVGATFSIPFYVVGTTP